MFKKLFVFILFVLGHAAFSQKIEIGGGVGPTYYKGDIQPTFRIFNPSVGASAFVRYNASRVISLKANFFYGNVKGDDVRSGNRLNYYRGFKFTNTLMDYYAQVEYNFLNFRTHNGRFEHQWTPYLYGGLGMMKIFKKKLSVNNDPAFIMTNLSPDPVLPFGIGYKKILNGKWNFGVEFTTMILLRKKNADIFDGFGYVEKINKGNYTPTSAAIPNYRATTYANTLQPDKYFQVQITASYLFYKVNCPPRR